MRSNGRRRAAPALTAALALVGGLLLAGGTRGLAQDDPAPADSPPRPSHVHVGDCDELGEIIQPLTALTVPGDEVGGNADAVLAEAAFTGIPRPLAELLAEDHAIKVHLSQAEIQTYLACGDIGGAVDANGALIVGLKELDGSGYTGIAYLAPDGAGGTSVSVMIAKVLPGGGPGDDAPPEQDASAEPDEADDDAAAAGAPEVVGVALNEFTIGMPTELAAGPTRFNVSNVGNAPHSFVIEGDGIAERIDGTLGNRQSAALELDLPPGTYTVFCPVGDGAHRANGMERQLTVE